MKHVKLEITDRSVELLKIVAKDRGHSVETVMQDALEAYADRCEADILGSLFGQAANEYKAKRAKAA